MLDGRAADAKRAQVDADDRVLDENLAWVRARARSAAEGVFGERSVAWTVYRESALLLGGLRALLLQLAHPAVAAGVASHSDFQRDPYRRAWRTFEMTYRIVFGGTEAACATAARIHARHHAVRGALPSDSGPAHAYRANDPELLLWVHATLIDTSLRCFERFVRPLSPDERLRLHEENRLAAALFGIPPSRFPETLADFDAYVARMLDGGLAVGDTARALVRALLAPPPILRLASVVPRRLAPALLPPALRDGFRLPFGDEEARRHARDVALIRAAVAAAPDAVRFVPAYHQARARVARAAGRPAPVEARLLPLFRLLGRAAG